MLLYISMEIRSYSWQLLSFTSNTLWKGCNREVASPFIISPRSFLDSCLNAMHIIIIVVVIHIFFQGNYPYTAVEQTHHIIECTCGYDLPGQTFGGVSGDPRYPPEPSESDSCVPCYWSPVGTDPNSCGNDGERKDTERSYFIYKTGIN